VPYIAAEITVYFVHFGFYILIAVWDDDWRDRRH